MVCCTYFCVSKTGLLILKKNLCGEANAIQILLYSPQTWVSLASFIVETFSFAECSIKSDILNPNHF